MPSTRARIFAKAVSRRRRGVVAEGRESAVVASCRAARRGCIGRLEDPVPDFLRRLDARVDGGDDADEDPLVGLQVLADDLQDADAVLLARQGDVEVPGLQLEQAGQQLGVIDVAAVGRVAVAARAGVDADALALFGARTATARGCSGR